MMVRALIMLLLAAPVLAYAQPDANDIVAKMKVALDLQEEQVTNITPVIQKYSLSFEDLQKSINDGTINPSAVDSQWQGIEAQETQELSAYLKPYQLSQWRNMQHQLYQQKDSSDDADQYSNLPRVNSP